MRRTLGAGLCIAALLFAVVPAHAALEPPYDVRLGEWIDVVSEQADKTAPHPTSSARLIALAMVAMYDAWAAYDPVAVGLLTGNALDGMGGEPAEENQVEAMIHAIYNVAGPIGRSKNPFLDLFENQGLRVESDDPAAKLGRRIAAIVIAARQGDGANDAQNYVDTSGYVPAGSPGHWQPIIDVFDPDRMLQMAMTPHWRFLSPITLRDAKAYRAPPPPAFGSPEWHAQVEEIIRVAGNLTIEEKAIAEYWIPWDGWSASHLMRLTRDYLEAHPKPLGEQVKLYLAAAVAQLDTAIVCWDTKYHYDYERPETAIRRLGERRITVWTPWGTNEIAAKDFEPYLTTPPFPEYTSGHSTITAAWARTMELVTGSEAFDYEADVISLRRDALPFTGVTLRYPTFRSAAEDSGLSRIYGGIHWPIANEEGQKQGRAVAEEVVAHLKDAFEGRARPAEAPIAELSPGLWEPEGEGAVAMTDTSGLMLYGGEAPARWRAATLDPFPKGPLSLSIHTQAMPDNGDLGALAVTVRTADGTNRVLATGKIEGAGWVRAAWVSDGRTPITLELERSGPRGIAVTRAFIANLDG
ncbi:MAG: phosphatase PAP2 family protein [Alphaproteobacteria bacterium]|nr:phosphatase PAP2 family protein [Alphaproteobacteria bacterium]